MKNNYNIKFKHGINYRGEIDVLNLKLLDDKPKPEIRLKNFDDALDSMNTRTLRQLRNFIAREPFDLYSDETGNVELKKVLQEMLPSLFLRKNQALLKKLKILGFNNEVKNLFVEKRKLDKGIRELMKIMNIDKSIEPAFRVDLYSIINMRLRLKIQEALGFGYFITEERYITNTKDSLEKLQRIRREGKKLSEKGLNPAMKRLVEFINSEAGKSLLDINNEVASQNHDGSYNVRYLGLQLLHNIKLFNKKKASTRQILLSLYDIFIMIYSEKKLFKNEEEWTKGKSSIGKNFSDYKIKKVSSIVGYKSEKELLKDLEKYEPPGLNLKIKDFKNILSKI